MIVMSGGCRLLHTLLPLNLREERFVMGPGALTVIFWLRYLSEHVQYDSDDKLKVTSSPAGQAGGDQAGVALKLSFFLQLVATYGEASCKIFRLIPLL